MRVINKEELKKNKDIHFYEEKISIPNELWIYFNRWLETNKIK